jgi:hypothetical protein
MVNLYTTRGLLRSVQVGAILPDEHIFANFYTASIYEESPLPSASTMLRDLLILYQCENQ